MWSLRPTAAAIALATLTGCGSDDAPPSPDAVEPTVDAGREAGQDPTAPQDVSFAFSGEDGEGGCRYDGPEELGTELTSTATNLSDREVFITLARIAEGASVEDFDSYVSSLGDSYPVVVPPGDHQPSAHDWLEGTWLQLHTVPGGESQTVEKTAMFEGDYVAFCYRARSAGPGSELWPAGTLRVAGEPTPAR